MNEILNALRPVVRRLRLNRFRAGASAGLAVGAGLALAVQVLSFWIPLPGKGWIMAACVAACALAAGTGNALRKVPPRMAAEAADGCGLKERAVTALEETGNGEMAKLLREDACRQLQHLDPRRIPGPRTGRKLLAALGCALAAAGLFLVPNPAERQMAEEAAFMQELSRAAAQAEEAAAKDEKALSETEKSELRKLAADLKRDLEASRDRADALVALDRAEQRAERLRQRTAADALQSLADALAAAGMEALAEALKTGDEAALAEQLEAADAEKLAKAAERLEGSAKKAAQALASAGANGDASRAAAARSAMDALDAESRQAVFNLSSALSKLNAQMGGTGTKTASSQGEGDSEKGTSGKGNSGSGSSGMGSQPGGGAGRGSTNEDMGTGQAQNSAGAKGSEAAEYRDGQFETIYDPERFDRATRDEMTNLNRQGEDSVQVETGSGRGTLQGDVPYGEVVREYAEAGTQAADRANLTDREKQWVRDYFTLLADQ